MKDELTTQILDFVNRVYHRDPEIVATTAGFLEAADYQSLVSFMEEIDRDHRRNAGVLHFEILGQTYELQGEALIEHDIQAAIASYETALGAYEQGMHFATGSGEGWHFRDLFDKAKRRKGGLARRRRP